MSWETQGPLADRTKERLATSDRGVVMLREMMKREIEKVRSALDPIGVIRDPSQNTIIDTKLMESLHGPEYQHRLRVPPKTELRAS